MTKRVLSLLLTLVMVLSLGAPAFAADEFEAEAPAEVVEEAPAAPVEPEAPEAEEAEEPVAEEPIDEPVAAAAVEVEEETSDVPATIAVGEVNALVTEKFDYAMEQAKALKAKVDAGEVYIIGTASFEIGKPEGRISAFTELYKTALEYQTGLATGDYDGDITQEIIDETADSLLNYIDEDDTSNFMTDKWDSAKIDPLIEDGNGKIPQGTLTALKVGDIASTLTIKKDTKAADVKAELDASHRPEYVEAAMKAITAVQALMAVDPSKRATTLKYADFTKAENLIIAAAKLADSTKKDDYIEGLTSADARALLAALQKVIAAQKDGSITKYEKGTTSLAESNNGSAPVSTAVGMIDTGSYLPSGKSLVQTIQDDIKNKTSNASAALEKVIAEGKLGLTGSASSYAAYKQALDALALKEVTKDVKVTITRNGMDSVDVTITPNKYDMGTYIYTYTVQSGGKTYYYWPANGNTDKTPVWKTGAPTKADWVDANVAGTAGESRTVTISALKALPLGANNTKVGDEDDYEYNNATVKFESSDRVTVTVCEKIPGTGSFAAPTYGKEYTAAYTFPKDGYTGPEIAAPETGKKNPSVDHGTADGATGLGEVKNITEIPAVSALNGKTADTTQTVVTVKYEGNFGVNYDISDAGYKYGFRVKEGSTEVGYVGDNGGSVSIADQTHEAKILVPATDKTVNGLDLTVELLFNTTDKKDGLIAHDDSNTVAAIALEPLSKWDEMKKVDKLIEVAEALKVDDYELAATFPNASLPNIKTVNDAWKVFQTSLTELKKLADDADKAPNLTGQRNAVINAVTDLCTKFEYVTKKGTDAVDKTALVKALAAAEAGYAAYQKESGDDTNSISGAAFPEQDVSKGLYTWSSWNALVKAFKEAYDQNDEGTKQDEIDKATKALNDAIAGLVRVDGVANKTALTAAIAKAESLTEKDYTEDSWKAVDTALTAAKAVSAKANATQTEVDKAAKALNDAIDALVKTGDKAALEAAVKAAEALKKDDYTEATWTAFETALKAAQDVLAKAEPSAAEIDAAAKALKQAQDNLARKPATEPEIPAAPATNDRTWLQASDGTWYCYINKQLQKSKWIYSRGGLYYYVDKDGKMLEGFQKIDGVYYMLQNDDTNGTRGTIVTSKDGWIYNSAIPGGCAYAINKHNGRFGEITWTQAGGDYNRSTQTWSKG